MSARVSPSCRQTNLGRLARLNRSAHVSLCCRQVEWVDLHGWLHRTPSRVGGPGSTAPQRHHSGSTAPQRRLHPTYSGTTRAAIAPAESAHPAARPPGTQEADHKPASCRHGRSRPPTGTSTASHRQAAYTWEAVGQPLSRGVDPVPPSCPSSFLGPLPDDGPVAIESSEV